MSNIVIKRCDCFSVIRISLIVFSKFLKHVIENSQRSDWFLKFLNTVMEWYELLKILLRKSLVYIFVVNFFQSKYLNVINNLYVILISVIFIMNVFQSAVLLIEAIRTISSLFIFFYYYFLTKRFRAHKNTNKFLSS